MTPPHFTHVPLDKATRTRTRTLIESAGLFALQLPTQDMAAQTVGVGTGSVVQP